MSIPFTIVIGTWHLDISSAKGWRFFRRDGFARGLGYIR